LRDLAAKRLAKENPEKKFVNRVGLSVSKKIGGAVVRNRVKRIIRVGYDTHKAGLKTGFLIVISARSAAANKKSTDIARELSEAFATLNMFVDISADKKTTEE
jgi:ribonuclease P protein component